MGKGKGKFKQKPSEKKSKQAKKLHRSACMCYKTCVSACMCYQSGMGAGLCARMCSKLVYLLICAQKLICAPKLICALVCAPKHVFKKKMYLNQGHHPP